MFHTALKASLPELESEIIKRSDKVQGFVVLPGRWILKRTIAWLGCCRRLACLKGMRSIKDFENLTRNARAFLKLAAIRFMLRKLCSS